MFDKIKSARSSLLIGAAVVAVLAAGYFGWHYVAVGRFLESTDDAYLKADITAVSPRIAGYVTEVLVNDNMPVKKGQVLCRIDDHDYRARVAGAEADVASAAAKLVNLDARIALQQSQIDRAAADVSGADAGRHFAQSELTRYAALAQNGAGTRQRADQSETMLRQASADLAKTHAGLDSAHQQLAVLQTERALDQATLDAKKATLELARIDLANTVVVSPGDGVAGMRMLRVGQYVRPGTQLLAVVPLDAIYVLANFKETQLGRIRRGSPVTVRIDSFPGQPIDGHVDSVAPASGAEFSLLPPDNATGNFTKIVQRIPVKIVLDPNNPLAGLLRPGMSVTPTVDTRDDRQPAPIRTAGP